MLHSVMSRDMCLICRETSATSGAIGLAG